ncbi:hypothetical protein D7030_09880 [Flavobacteriaceae bacterium AU392]|nr:hypothetical protein D1817_06930 [Flavobacteriaceae bacterium]RKM83596.1 hypothetical protein D7030_09880 [Flavobacteriaceae bacterium AU392]
MRFSSPLSILIVLFITFSSSSIIAQQNIEKDYAQYFELPRESVYLHLNKSDYVFGEDIWFKGYIYDRKNNKPTIKTSNIYVGLYDESGNQIKNDLFLGYEGLLRGNFEIDSTLTTGKYYVKASTYWMRNFIEDDTYSAEIRIINDKDKFSKTTLTDSIYDLQLLPESGYALLGIKNTIGVKVINSKGEGVEINEGQVLDQDQNHITSFKTNSFGLGKFQLTYKIGKSYQVIAKLGNGQTINKLLSVPQNIGANINVINAHGDKIIISVNKTIKTIDSIFKVLIHKNGISKSFNVNLNNNTSSNISIPRTELFEGINILTLINDKQQPIAERLIYNHRQKNKKIRLVYEQKVNDSIQLNLSLPQNESIYYNLSISVLPYDTKAYNHSDNIISNFKLLPYLKGNVENSRYYFTNINRRKKHDLDLLLLTQGWSRYRWFNIFNQKPKAIFKFENGLTLKGNLKPHRKYDTLKTLYLFPFKNSTSQFIEVDSTFTFSIPNLYPETNEIIKFTFASERKIKEKPELNTQLIINSSSDKINLEKIKNKIKLSKTPLNSINLKGLITDKTITLDEILILSKAEKQKRIERAFNDVVYIQEDDTKFTLVNFLRQNGYNIRTNNRGITSVTRFIRGSQRPQLLVLNGAVFPDGGIVNSLSMKEIEKLYLNKNRINNIKFGRNGQNGVIEIFTKKIIPGKNISTTVSLKKVKKGFKPYKEFYTPKYNSFNSPVYKKYGTIHWIPDITLEHETQTIIIPDHEQETIRFYIEGMSDTGDLISEVISINIPDIK